MHDTQSITAPAGDFAAETARRRTFAIISHPDAGKTTLTEKLLLYGGAIHLAGAVKARRAQRHATSDWMALEQERGISVTSSVMQFEYAGYKVNLLDTPGHGDFSEDTYRTLVAADSAVMLLDNRRGVEERTRQLFDVCRMRRTPIFTFVNKCDRVGAPPLQLIGDVESDLGIRCYPMTWPIFADGTFLGVFERATGIVHLFERGAAHGAERAAELTGALDDPVIAERLGASADVLREELELLDMAGEEFDPAAVLAGTLSPVFFGSALTNFGVEPFLQSFLPLAPAPLPRESSAGPIGPSSTGFSGFVFKIQANMDPKHRDRIAFVRIVSGRFEAGMSALHVRSGKPLRLTAPQQFLARERTAVEEAWPGDVIGLHDRGTLRIGDTLTDGATFEFAHIPRFSPELFARVRLADPLRRKQLDTGLRQLSEEGAAQVFYEDSIVGPSPIVGAVGQLQFDVLLHRLEHEYAVPARLERLGFSIARWVVGDADEIARVGEGYGKRLVYDSRGAPLILFENEYTLRGTLERETGIQFFAVAP
ncbi:MAG TPA: peptide chain release factor 3 [Gemmatimonadales bacterium]|nr:peptide chain release factor 3 [Gemmatimonadales bacterium]